MRDTPAPKKYLRLKNILQRIPVCRTTLIEGIKSGRFKLTPIKNGRCVFYDADEVELLLQTLAE